MPCKAPTKLQIVVLVAYVVNLVVTYLSNTGLYGCTNKAVSDEYYTVITPPGWAFAIWGLIFMWEGVACVAQMVSLGPLPGLYEPIVDAKFAAWWCLACLVQCCWSVSFCHSIPLSAFFLASIFAALVGLQQTSLRKLEELPPMEGGSARGRRLAAYLLFVAPFSVHLGWVTAASALNVNLAAVAGGASATVQIGLAVCSLLWVHTATWTIGVCGTGYAHGSTDVANVAATVWAFAAVAHHEIRPVATSTDPVLMPQDFVGTPLSTAAKFAAIVLSLGWLIRVVVTAVCQHLAGETCARSAMEAPLVAAEKEKSQA